MRVRWRVLGAIAVTVIALVQLVAWVSWAATTDSGDPLTFFINGMITAALLVASWLSWHRAVVHEREERWRAGERGVVDDAPARPHRGLNGDEEPPARW
ncbi:MAG: hypothetical protein KQH57_08840 [Actinomycetales bacterium]|nr:hypothetical protein [Actinomycetales bacterium]